MKHKKTKVQEVPANPVVGYALLGVIIVGTALALKLPEFIEKVKAEM